MAKELWTEVQALFVPAHSGEPGRGLTRFIPNNNT